jgi:hypothetical protein
VLLSVSGWVVGLSAVGAVAVFIGSFLLVGPGAFPGD